MDKEGRVILNAEGASNQCCLPRSINGGWIHSEASAACRNLPPERLTADHSSADNFFHPAFAVKAFSAVVDAPPETTDL